MLLCSLYLDHGGSDVVTNGTFDADTNWTKGTGWDIGVTTPGVAHCDGTQSPYSNLYQSGILVVGTLYKVIYEVTAYTTGQVDIYIGVGSQNVCSNVVGTHTFYATCATNTTLYVQADETYVGSLDNISATPYTLRRVSNEELALEHSWYAEIINAPTITKATAKEYGGYVQMRWGDITCMPTTFEDAWPPPKSAGVLVEWTATTEAAAVELFTGTLHRKQIKRDGVTYSMYAEDFDISVDSEAFTGALIAEFGGIATDLGLTVDTSDARVVADTDYTASGILVQLASNLAAYFAHFFYIDSGTLYLVDMLDYLTAHTLTEFDYEPVTYSDKPPYSRIEDGTFGIDGSYTYGSTLSVSPNCESTEADAETALGNIKTIMEKPRVTLSCPMTADTIDIIVGDRITYDNETQDISGVMYVRSIRYDFNRSFIVFEGEGTVT